MTFETVRLGDICITNQLSYSPKDKWNHVNYLDTGNITQNCIDEIQSIDLTTEKLPSRAKRKVKHNSIIFSTVRPNQLHYGIIKEQPENFLVSTGFTVIDVYPNKADADFVYYSLTQTEIIQHLQAIAEQSTSAYPSIKASDIEDLEIVLPDIETQRRISAIFQALDKKKVINAAINENLCLQAA
ncbi:MAG: Type I restriction modification DNA specificity domain protein [Firmicutes bacterium ADurb.BinA205]|nr:MAG: Type I restriction modification DNA specificity domain protein [Firmicutes bacterium ADurb.BinA205]